MSETTPDPIIAKMQEIAEAFPHSPTEAWDTYTKLKAIEATPPPVPQIAPYR